MPVLRRLLALHSWTEGNGQELKQPRDSRKLLLFFQNYSLFSTQRASAV